MAWGTVGSDLLLVVGAQLWLQPVTFPGVGPGGGFRGIWKVPWGDFSIIHLPPRPSQGLTGTVATFLQ